MSAGRRVGVSASGEVRLLFGAAIIPGGLDGVDDALQTPTHRYADTFPLAAGGQAELLVLRFGFCVLSIAIDLAGLA